MVGSTRPDQLLDRLHRVSFLPKAWKMPATSDSITKSKIWSKNRDHKRKPLVPPDQYLLQFKKFKRKKKEKVQRDENPREFVNGNETVNRSDELSKKKKKKEEKEINKNGADVDQVRESEDNVLVSGKDINDLKYKALSSFSESKLPEELLDSCKNFNKPSPIQSNSWPFLLHGRDFIGIDKSGSGKTLAFGIPAMNHILNKRKNKTTMEVTPLCLVLSPTRELAQQIFDVLCDAGKPSGVRSVCVYGGTSNFKELQISVLKSGVDIVIGTPGHLKDLIEMGLCQLQEVSFVVLDEADRMLEMGSEPEVRSILSKTSSDRQVVMFSATWPLAMNRLAQEFMDPNPVKVVVGSEDLAADHDVMQIAEVMAGLSSRPQKQRMLEAPPSSSSSDDEPQLHPWLRFEHSDFRERLSHLLGKRFEASRTLHWGTLDMLGLSARTRAMIGPVWGRFFNICEPQYKELCLEFFSTFHFETPCNDYSYGRSLTFRLGGEDRHCSLREFALKMGIYMEEELETTLFVEGITSFPQGVNPHQFWTEIGDGVYNGNNKSTKLRDPLHRILHRAIAHSIAGRRESTGVVTLVDLFFLYCFIHPATCNVAYALAEFLMTSMGKRLTGYICGGSFVTQLARSYGILNPKVCASMISFLPTHHIDMTVLQNMKVVERLPNGDIKLLDGQGNPWDGPLEQPQQAGVGVEADPRPQQDGPEQHHLPACRIGITGRSSGASRLSELQQQQQQIIQNQQTMICVQQAHHSYLQWMATTLQCLVTHLGVRGLPQVPPPAADMPDDITTLFTAAQQQDDDSPPPPLGT